MYFISYTAILKCQKVAPENILFEYLFFKCFLLRDFSFVSFDFIVTFIEIV